MTTAKVSSEIDAPVENVFDLFTDIEHAAEHVSAIEEIKILSSGPMNLGFRWVETREVLGRLDEAEMEITAFERNHTYTITHHKAGVRIDAVFTFEPIETGTKVGIEFDLNPQGLPPGLLSPLEWIIGRHVGHALAEDLQDFKGIIDRIALLKRMHIA